MIKEDEFYNTLLKERERNKINVSLGDIAIVPNYKLRDSPDFVLKIRLKLSLLSQNFEMEIPIPIELEKAGIDKALMDLRKFIKREKFALILPMFIISDKRVITQEREGKLKTKFKLRQIPYRLVR